MLRNGYVLTATTSNPYLSSNLSVLVKEFGEEVARVQEKGQEVTEKLAKEKKKLKEVKEIEMELRKDLAKKEELNQGLMDMLAKLKVEENQS